MAEIEELGMTVVAYHGTNRPDFTRFDIAVSGIFGTTANCRKRRSIDLRFLRYEGLTAVA